MKIMYLSTPEYLSNGIIGAVAKAAKDDCNIVLRCHESAPIENTPGDVPVCMSIPKTEMMLNVLDAIKRRDPRAFFYIRELKTYVWNMLDITEPDAIVSTSDMGGLVNRMCNQWALKHEVPYFIIQPSFLENPPASVYGMFRAKARHTIFDVILGLNTSSRQWYYGCENPKNYLLVWGKDQLCQVKDTEILKHSFLVGNPALDKFSENTVKTNIDVKPVVLYCSQPYDKLVELGLLTQYQRCEMYNIISGMVRSNPDKIFLIKLHPSEYDGYDRYEKLLHGCTNVAIVSNEVDFQELCLRADIQISMASYASFEAIVMGVPVILLHPEFLGYFEQFEGMPHVQNLYDLNRYLDRYSMETYRREFEKDRKRYIERKLHNFGTSAIRTVKVIHSVVEWQKNKSASK